MKPPEEHIPSKRVTIPYYFTAALSFVLTTVLCLISAPDFAGHFFQPKLLAITHLAVLGWATMVIFGASNQLAPVIAGQRLYSERLSVIVLIIKISGIALLVLAFWNFTFTWHTYAGGGLILTAVGLHAINIYNTVKKEEENIISNFIVAAHAWLFITAMIGLMLLIHLRFPFLPQEHLTYLKVHANIGIAGWFLQLVIGVSARLIPMFLLSRREETKWLRVTYYMLNTGLIVFFINGWLLHSEWLKNLSILALLPGLFFYIRYIRACYKSAMRRQTDQGMKQTFLALSLLSIPFILLFVISLSNGNIAPNLATAYGFSFFGGFISTIIMGQTFKTLPFIVWMHITRPDQLPELMPKDLFREHWVKGQMIFYLPGILIFLSGILWKQSCLLYTGAGFMTIAAVWYLLHVLLIIKKLRRHA